MAEPSSPETSNADRLLVLAQAARALHGERDQSAAIAWAVKAAGDLTGLDHTAICLLPRHGSPTWTTAGSPVDFSRLGDPRTSALLRADLDAGNPIVVFDIAAAESALPPRDRIRGSLPLAGLLVAPVMSRDGLAQGAILAGSTEPVDFDEEMVEGLMALAAHLGVALDNSATLARMAEVEARGKEVVHALQEAVRPPAPIVPFTELGVHYVAADPSAPTGGDLYDWVMLPDGQLHLAIVDVMGKGVEATKHALAVTHALRLLAVEGCPLKDIVARADVLVTAQNPELVATLLVVHYDPETGRLALAGAGHPPALVVSVDGRVREVAAPGIPIGWPGAGSHEIVTLDLERSDTLILYTDGLIEATKDILKGLEDLAAAASATATYPATSLARALVERQLADAARHDDSVALVLRRRAPATDVSSHALARFVHRFSPQAAAVPVARHLMRDWLVRVPVDDDALDALLLIASELCSNAVRHASGEPGSVTLEAWTEEGAVYLEVTDDGGSLLTPELIGDELPDPEAEQGRGLFLVRELADEVSSRVDDGRTTIRVCRHAAVAERVST
jgi:anti-sigma regulatory factor (Ser/Thr protein kinase)